MDDERIETAVATVHRLRLVGSFLTSFEQEEIDTLAEFLDVEESLLSSREAASVVFMAMGEDLSTNATHQNMKRNLPILRKLIEVRQMFLDAAHEEVREESSRRQREEWLRGTGLL